jgi:hypothetical protein
LTLAKIVRGPLALGKMKTRKLLLYEVVFMTGAILISEIKKIISECPEYEQLKIRDCYNEIKQIMFIYGEFSNYAIALLGAELQRDLNIKEQKGETKKCFNLN